MEGQAGGLGKQVQVLHDLFTAQILRERNLDKTNIGRILSPRHEALSILASPLTGGRYVQKTQTPYGLL